ncbi:hypothetical protein [Streptomyces lanatus]|uniref:Uncharacterized protein n=1 Tax=Streptomyces lanatus TaxID=66900 RepID=A0ABV1XZX1_9ACTN|nr:hypothetical protein [Streptomyces lanatus]GHH22464.1 hypothetical protein GCM10018780_70960 [Streptomyces lanatus]
MTLALAVKPWWELAEQYGQPRTVMHHAAQSFPVPREQHEAYAFNIAAGKVLRESGVRAANGKTWALTIRLVEYIEPVTLRTRYALDFWTVTPGGKWYVADHDTRAVIEGVYEYAVHIEADRPSVPVDAERVGRGPVAYYDVTDVA